MDKPNCIVANVLTAWGDESGSDRRRDPGTYILAAAIIDDSTVAVARDKISKLLLPDQRKVHWWHESDKRRDLIASTIGNVGISAVVIVRVGPLDNRDERRRRKCLERLLSELEEMNCGELILESRGRNDDERDRQMLHALRSARRVTSPIRLEHVVGPDDPMLWAADALCGATVAARLGNPRWQKLIERDISVISVDLKNHR